MDLSGKTDEEVFRLAANCIWEVMTRRRLADKAQHLLEKAAYPEIERRCRGPETGLLHAFGYHVGSTDPVPRDRRHAILRYVFRSRLPVVQDETHMAEWGQPLSDTRRERIASTLRWFLDKNSWRPDMARARTEWNSDCEFVMSEEFAPAHAL